MNTEGAVEILLVEDNPHDAELTLRALRIRNLANTIVWLKDGAEAADYLFGAPADLRLGAARWPRVILLDLKLPKMMAWTCCAGSRPTHGRNSSRW
jgi:CheY-like chemotaxis protein